MDAGWRSALFLDPNFVRIYPNDANFNALRTRMRSLIHKDRAALGLAPF